MLSTNDLLIVDGYNILGSWNFTNDNYNLEAARYNLEELLADYSGYKGMDIILVFDAHNADTYGSSERKHKLKTIYTKRGETADTKIESMLKKVLRKYRYVYVATADYALQLFTLGEGGLRLTPTELKVMIEEKTKRKL